MEVGCFRLGIVILVGRFEAVGDLGQRLDAHAAREVIVERRDRLAEEHAVVGQPLVAVDLSAARQLEVQPARALVVECRVEPVWRSGRGMALAGVGDLHWPESIGATLRLMLTGIDHLIVASADPDLAVAELEQVLGLRATGGGRHEAQGTFNRLIWLGDSYLELMGVFDRALAAESWWGRHISGLLDASPGAYAGLALASDDLDAEVSRLRAQGAPIGDPIAGERRRTDGEVVRWSIARPPDVDDELGLTFLIQHDPTAAEWRPADREARAEEVHPLGGPVRLARAELPVTDMRRSTMRVHRDLGVPFRPSLAGGGARDGTVGGQTLRLVRAAPGRPPTVVMRGGRETREADLCGCRFRIEAASG